MLVIETYQLYVLAASIVLSAIIGSVAFLIGILIRENSLNQRTITKMGGESSSGGLASSSSMEDKIFELLISSVVSNPQMIGSIFSGLSSAMKSGRSGHSPVTQTPKVLSTKAVSTKDDLAPGLYRAEDGSIQIKSDANGLDKAAN